MAAILGAPLFSISEEESLQGFEETFSRYLKADGDVSNRLVDFAFALDILRGNYSRTGKEHLIDGLKPKIQWAKIEADLPVLSPEKQGRVNAILTRIFPPEEE